MMKKIFSMILVCLVVLLARQNFNSHCYAVEKFLNGDTNYPRSYGHANWHQYVDLKSCRFVYNNNFSYEMAVGYVELYIDVNKSVYRIKYFRQNKDGYSLPQVSSDGNNWTTIPSWRNEEAVNRSMDPNQGGSYYNFERIYLPASYHMFKMAYKELWGVEYADL